MAMVAEGIYDGAKRPCPEARKLRFIHPSCLDSQSDSQRKGEKRRGEERRAGRNEVPLNGKRQSSEAEIRSG